MKGLTPRHSFAVPMLKVFLIFAIFLLIGCVRHVDRLAVYKVTGQVFAKAVHEPLDGANVSFLDTGLDSSRSKTLTPIDIGRSQSDGLINVQYEYYWGTEEGLLAKSAPGTFCVLIDAPNFQQVSFCFVQHKLPAKGNMIDVALGKVWLEQR